MDEFESTLTDKELIEAVLSWYAENQSPAQLRLTVEAYLRSNQQSVSTHSLPTATSMGIASQRNEDSTSSDAAQTDILDAASAHGPRNFKSNDVARYPPLADSSEDPARRGGWLIDGWEIYYAIEDHLDRVSFGFLTMQTLAVLCCVFISAAVIVGAWQINSSNERQKKATFKSMPLEEPAASPSPTTATQLADSTDKEQVEEMAPVQVHFVEFEDVIRSLDQSAWEDALVSVQRLESDIRPELKPLLSLLKIESLLQKRDAGSLELARQELMDGKFGEHKLLFELLVGRWVLLSSAADRARFLSESAALPSSERERMTIWARVRNRSADVHAVSILKSAASSSPSNVCDQLFLASCHHKAGKSDQTVRELLEMQQRLRALRSEDSNSAAAWLLEASKAQLTAKADEFLATISRQKSE